MPTHLLGYSLPNPNPAQGFLSCRPIDIPPLRRYEFLNQTFLRSNEIAYFQDLKHRMESVEAEV